MRIVGIDIGSSSIKAVEVDSAFGRFEVHDYHEVKLAPGADAAGVSASLNELIHSLPKSPDRVVVTLRTAQSTFRNLTLPTKDRKSIQAGVGFELEDELPFPADDSVHDYAILNQTKQSSVVHVGATLKRHLVAALGVWTGAPVDPDVVTTEAWAYRGFLNRIITPENQSHPILLVQMGHEHTTLYIQHKGVPILAREVPWGGRDLTMAICQKYGMSVDQAETAKLDHGFIIPESQKGEATPEQLEFSESMAEAVNPLLNDLKQAELTCKNLTQQDPGTLYLAGGTSMLPGFARAIEDYLRIPTRPLHGLSQLASTGVTYSEHTEATFLLAAAGALSVVGSDRNSAINLRKAEFAKKGTSRELNFAVLKKPLISIGVVSFCLFLSLIVQSSVYKSRLVGLDAQLDKSVRGFFGQITSSGVKTYLGNTTSLRTAINREIGKQRDMNKLMGQNAHSPIDFLKDLSVTVPKGIVVDMIQFQVGSAPTASYLSTAPADTEAAVSLSFLVANPQVAEKLAGLLSGKLSAFNRSKIEEAPAPDGNGKRWKITFSGKATEDSYGK